MPRMTPLLIKEEKLLKKWYARTIERLFAIFNIRKDRNFLF